MDRPECILLMLLGVNTLFTLMHELCSEVCGFQHTTTLNMYDDLFLKQKRLPQNCLIKFYDHLTPSEIESLMILFKNLSVISKSLEKSLSVRPAHCSYA